MLLLCAINAFIFFTAKFASFSLTLRLISPLQAQRKLEKFEANFEAEVRRRCAASASSVGEALGEFDELLKQTEKQRQEQVRGRGLLPLFRPVFVSCHLCELSLHACVCLPFVRSFVANQIL